MKLLFNSIFALFFLLLISCGGGGEETTTDTTKDSTLTASEDENATADDTSEEVVEETPSLDLEDEDVKILINRWMMTSFIHEDGRSEEGLEGDYVTFKEDGTYEEKVRGNTVATGDWNLDKTEGKVIVFKVKTGEFIGNTSKWVIDDLQADKLVVKDDDGKMTETYMVQAPEENEEAENTEEETPEGE